MHPSSCRDPDCQLSYREHLLGISLDSSALPTRKREARATNAREARWSKDMPAYRRLRDNGLQPRGIDGSASLEARANDRLEVESGQLASRAQVARARELITSG